MVRFIGENNSKPGLLYRTYIIEVRRFRFYFSTRTLNKFSFLPVFPHKNNLLFKTNRKKPFSFTTGYLEPQKGYKRYVQKYATLEKTKKTLT